MKVLYFTNLTVPYRKDFFSELGKYCELYVWVENEERRNSNSKWLKSGREENYVINVLPKLNVFNKIEINYGYKKDFFSENFDLVVVGTYYSISAQIFINFLSSNRVPFILNSDGGFIKEDRAIKKSIKRFYMKKATAYLSTGSVTSDYLFYYGGEKKTYLYPFTSIWEKDLVTKVISDDEKNKLKKNLNINYDHILISVGSCIYRKGYDVLLRAVDTLDKSIGVYLIGGKETDDQLLYLKQYVEKNELSNVHFVPFMEKNELKMYYMAADIFVLPTREDIWGLVINEAMGYGLPIVTTDRCIAGLEMVKEGENGYLVEKENVAGLENAIKSILSNNALRENMARNSLSIASEYTIEKMALAHKNAFIDFLNNHLE